MMGENIPEYLWVNQSHDAPFDQKFKLILNLAIGGNFFGDSMNSGSNEVKPPWDIIEMGSHPAVQFLERIDEWYNWGDEKYNIKKDNVCTLSWKECITDDVKCDKYENCYLDSEKHLAYEKPKISGKTMFQIRNIEFIEY